MLCVELDYRIYQTGWCWGRGPIFKWCNSNLKGRYTGTSFWLKEESGLTSRPMSHWRFDSDQDAVAFMMKFGGVLTDC